MKLLSHKYHQRGKRDETECEKQSLQNNPNKEVIVECEVSFTVNNLLGTKLTYLMTL